MMDNWKEVMGTRSIGHLTDNDERLLNLCAANELRLGWR